MNNQVNSGIPEGLSKKEFFKSYVDKKIRTNINAGAVILYISAGLSLVIGLLGNTLNTVIYDIILCIVIGLGITLAKSRICAILATVYGVASCIISLVTAGTFTSWLLIIGGIASIIGTFSFSKLWDSYQKGELATPIQSAPDAQAPIYTAPVEQIPENTVAEAQAPAEEAPTAGETETVEDSSFETPTYDKPEY